METGERQEGGIQGQVQVCVVEELGGAGWGCGNKKVQGGMCEGGGRQHSVCAVESVYSSVTGTQKKL